MHGLLWFPLYALVCRTHISLVYTSLYFSVVLFNGGNLLTRRVKLAFMSGTEIVFIRFVE